MSLKSLARKVLACWSAAMAQLNKYLSKDLYPLLKMVRITE
jgi:hypothetical protein